MRETADSRADVPPEDRQDLLSRLGPESLIPIGIGLATFLGYGCAFLFDLGYCWHFGVPGRMINVPWGGAVLAAAGLIFVAVYSSSTYKYHEEKNHRPGTVRILTAIVFLAALISVAIWSWLPIVVGTIGAKLLAKRVDNWLARISHRIDNSPVDDWPLTLLIGTIVLVGGIGCVAHSAGTSYAQKQSEFLTIDGENFVLAGAYDDRMIFSEYRPGHQAALTGELKVLSADDLKDLKLVWKEVGPLLSRNATLSPQNVAQSPRLPARETPDPIQSQPPASLNEPQPPASSSPPNMSPAPISAVPNTAE